VALRFSPDIPDWRRGAFAWKPLIDGREVTVYPLLGGEARLCVGPLAGQGYDIAYRYSTVQLACDAAEEWDGESSTHPAGFERMEAPEGKERPVAEAGEMPAPGTLVAALKGDKVTVTTDAVTGQETVEITRHGPSGWKAVGTGHRDVDGTLWCRVQDVRKRTIGGGALGTKFGSVNVVSDPSQPIGKVTAIGEKGNIEVNLGKPWSLPEENS
jgi:hypothetical protein